MYNAIEYKKYRNFYTVKLERNEDKRIFFVDVWVDPNSHEVDADWSQYIFSPTNIEDVIREKLQAQNDEFCDATASAICYLEFEGIIYQNEDEEWHYSQEFED